MPSPSDETSRILKWFNASFVLSRPDTEDEPSQGISDLVMGTPLIRMIKIEKRKIRILKSLCIVAAVYNLVIWKASLSAKFCKISRWIYIYTKIKRVVKPVFISGIFARLYVPSVTPKKWFAIECLVVHVKLPSNESFIRNLIFLAV